MQNRYFNNKAFALEFLKSAETTRRCGDHVQNSGYRIEVWHLPGIGDASLAFWTLCRRTIRMQFAPISVKFMSAMWANPIYGKRVIVKISHSSLPVSSGSVSVARSHSLGAWQTFPMIYSSLDSESAWRHSGLIKSSNSPFMTMLPFCRSSSYIAHCCTLKRLF